jgi:signal transduction histidine kinase
MDRVRTFVGGRFERVWESPAEREELARAIASELNAGIVLSGPDGAVIASFGPPCRRSSLEAPVLREGKELGVVSVCLERERGRGLLRIMAPLVAAGAILWALAGAVSRRISQPLARLAAFAGEIGEGRFGSRVDLGCRAYDETAVLAEAMNDMAARIQKQMADQRELLAGVSHELRTPLARIRLLAELAREGDTQKVLDDLDREVVEIDALVGDLLASSRLDFSAITPRELDAVEVAVRALERKELGVDKLVIQGNASKIEADPTLLSRALANLLDNAEKHGKGLDTFEVRFEGDRVTFESQDRGDGLLPGEEAKVFEPFYRRGDGGAREGSLGLGLALVYRIARAHGGRAFAKNRPEGGAAVGIEIPLRGGARR